jgi:hypothetical protein
MMCRFVYNYPRHSKCAGCIEVARYREPEREVMRQLRVRGTITYERGL